MVTLKKTLAPLFLRLTIWESIGHLVRLLHDHQLLGRVPEPVQQPLAVVLAVIVVLVEDADLRVGDVLQDVLRVDPALGLVVRLPAHRPRVVLRIVPLGRAGGHEEMGHLLLVHVLVDGAVRRRAERLEQRGHLVLLDELADHLDRLRRAVGVVVGDVVDLAPVDAALVVDLLEVGADGLADGAVGRGRAAVRVGVADLDLGRGDAGRLGQRRRRQGRHDRGQGQRHDQRAQDGSAQHAVVLLSSGPMESNLTPGNRQPPLGVPSRRARASASCSAPAMPRGMTYMKPIKNTP